MIAGPLGGPEDGGDGTRYAAEPDLSADEFVEVLRASGLAERRPVSEAHVIEGMLRHADAVVTARRDGKLIGVSRAVSDFHYCTYLSDLAVARGHQRQGIGRQLIELTHRVCGEHTTLILLAAPAARDYYGHIGMESHDSCWLRRGSSEKGR